MRDVLILVRGLPSAGKTTFVKAIIGGGVAADDYPGLYQDGKFMGGKEVDGVPMIKLAHIWCQNTVVNMMHSGKFQIAVTNTFTQRWEMQPYLDFAKEWGYRVFVIDLFDGGLSDAELAERSTHNVPEESIRRMRERYEHDWKSGNPLPL